MGKKYGVWTKKSSISQNYRSFTETTVMGAENILWKFELNKIIFPDFTGIGILKYKEIRVNGAKLFWGVYYAVMKHKEGINLKNPWWYTWYYIPVWNTTSSENLYHLFCLLYYHTVKCAIKKFYRCNVVYLNELNVSSLDEYTLNIT